MLVLHCRNSERLVCVGNETQIQQSWIRNESDAMEYRIYVHQETAIPSVCSFLLLSEDANGGDMQHSSFQSFQIHPEAQGK